MGLNLSPFKCLREISLALAVDRSMKLYLPRFSDITSGVVSKITIVAKLGSRVKELYHLFGKGYDWSHIDNDLLRLAEFQGGNNARRVEVVIDLRRVRLGTPGPSGRERKSFERNWWIQRASRYTLPKFSQAGTINFILPSSVSIPMLYFRIGGKFTSARTTLVYSAPPFGTRCWDKRLMEIIRPALVFRDIGLNFHQLLLYSLVGI